MGLFRAISGVFNHPLMKGFSYLLLWGFLGILGLHGYNTYETREHEGDYLKRVLVIDQAWYFKVLNPLAGDVLGFTLPAFPVAYVSRPAVERAHVDIEGVRVHEAKHLEQRDHLGIKTFLQTESWKLEGMAEYARGATTLDLCHPDPDAKPVRQKYRDYFITVSWLIEEKGLSEDEVYQYPNYPLFQATTWMMETRCGE